MASYDYYINQYDKTNKDKYNKQVQKVTDLANSTLTGTLNLIDQNTQSSIKPLEQKKEALPQQYQSYFDTNALQNLVNQRQLEERMANLGLTNSGLNRTQETALAVQKSNTAAAYNQKKQAAILSLDNQINELIASGNLKKQEATLKSKSALQSQLYSLEDTYNTNRQNYASSMEQADKQAAAQVEAARIKESKITLTEEQIDNALDEYKKNGEKGLANYAIKLSLITNKSADDILDYLLPYISQATISQATISKVKTKTDLLYKKLG